MWDLFNKLISGGFMPHGHCYLWTPSMVWLQVVSNALIGAAYVSISSTLYYIVRRIKDVPFPWMYIAFGIFIITCGGTHFLDVVTVWNPIYWVDGSLRAVTAVASVGTAVLLFPLIPKAIALASSAQLAHERGLRLETTHKQLAAAHEKTKELERIKTQFFANVSHELRTPLALVLGPAERCLADADLKAERRRDAEVIARNARLLLKHVNDLLDVSRLEAGKVKLDYEIGDLSAVVRLTAANFEGIAHERTMELSIESPETLPVEVDVDKVERILVNLLGNAFKFTPQGGRIRCTLRRGAQDGKACAILEVADSGPGVRLENRVRIFERFVQVDETATRQFGGTGLGLAIARDFVELHGGTLSVGDAPEGGACFVVVLPLRAPPHTEVRAADRRGSDMPERTSLALEDLRASVEAASTLAGQSADKPLVLVVEDNRDMNRFIAGTLAEGFRVEQAHNGEEGLKMALASAPDLVLADVMMPEMSGDQLVTELRRRDELDDMPIVLLTAKTDDELRVRLLREGAQDYLMKPFSPAELLARVKNLVTMKRARDVLRSELASQTRDLEALARQVSGRKRDVELALETARVARDHAEHASQLKTNFLAMVSHELRTPLTSLMLQIERLRRDKDATLTNNQRSIVDRMVGSATRLVGLVEGLLEYARIESGRLDVTIEQVDVRAVASELVEDLKPIAEAKSLVLKMEGTDDLPSLATDPRIVRIVLSNVVGNAIKFTERGSVVVALRHDAEDVVVTVTDTGPGIAREQHERLFEPFHQLEPMRHKHVAGVGLGLALVRELVTALGGRVALDSEVGRGTTFTLRFPRSGPPKLHGEPAPVATSGRLS